MDPIPLPPPCRAQARSMALVHLWALDVSGAKSCRPRCWSSEKNHLHWIWQHNLKSLEQTTERTALKGQPAFHSVPHTCKAVANHYHLMATHSIEYQAMSGPSKKPAEKKALKVQFSVGHLEYFDESTSYSSILYTVYLHNLVYLVSSFNLTLYCLTSAQVHIASAQAATWSTWRSMLEGSGQPCWRLRCRSH